MVSTPLSSSASTYPLRRPMPNTAAPLPHPSQLTAKHFRYPDYHHHHRFWVDLGVDLQMVDSVFCHVSALALTLALVLLLCWLSAHFVPILKYELIGDLREKESKISGVRVAS